MQRCREWQSEAGAHSDPEQRAYFDSESAASGARWRVVRGSYFARPLSITGAGLFVANHGSRFDPEASVGLHGYDVEFLPFVDGKATGEVQKFATGFDAGMLPLPDAAPHRPVGLAMMPDGSLLIGDDKGGRIWRVFYTGDSED